MAHKVFVLDTNVMLHDSTALQSFQDNTVVVPMATIEELDGFKREQNEIGRNARATARFLDDLRLKGVLTNGGVPLDNGGKLRVVVSGPRDLDALPVDLQKDSVDNRILALAKMEQARENIKSGGSPVVLITKDVNLRIKAAAVGVPAEDYETDKVNYTDLYTGTLEVSVPAEMIDEFYRKKGITPDKFFFDGLQPNQCVTLTAEGNLQQSALGRVNAFCDRIDPLIATPREGFWGIRPRNREQHFALDLLMNPDIDIVTMIGKAGTGKTLLAMAAGLSLVADENRYRRLMVSRPVVPMGRDIGFLPGEIEEKLAPWMQPIFDNVELLLVGMKDERGNRKKGYKDLVEMGLLEVEALTYIRGRSIPQQYMVVDEAQNLTPHEIKTIVSRAGEGTKIVLTGDPEQIDNPYVDAESNGLSYVVSRFQDKEIAGHITLQKGERSRLANLAAEVL